MSILSDGDIKQYVQAGFIGIEPYREEHVQPSSIDVTLSPRYRAPDQDVEGGNSTYWIDVADVRPGHTNLVDVSGWDDPKIIVAPGRFIIAETAEKVTIPDDLVARVEGKSSLGRLGLAVHITAGFIDPGFEGTITLEIANLAPWGLILRPGMKIAQLAFMTMHSPAEQPYGTKGHYQGQDGPTESRFKMDLPCPGCGEGTLRHAGPGLVCERCGKWVGG